LSASLQKVKDIAGKALGKSLTLTSVAVPQHFNQSMSSPVWAAVKHEEGMLRPWQKRPYYQAARLAYHLNSCEGFGLDPSCSIDDDTHLILFVDHNLEYVEFYLAEVTDFGLMETAKVRLGRHGAKSLVALEKVRGRSTSSEDKANFTRELSRIGALYMANYMISSTSI
jgi:hypothetical protein